MSTPLPTAARATHSADTEAADLRDFAVAEQLGWVRTDIRRLLLEYRSGLDEVRTKINILQQEFLALHDHNDHSAPSSPSPTPTRCTPSST